MAIETTDATPDLVIHTPGSALFEPGRMIDHYQLLDVVGSGGMGEVYLARDPDLDRQVAIKVVRGEVVRRSSELLLKEAQAMARLSHPNVVVCYQVGTVEGQVFLAMEYVEGETLRDRMKRGPRPWRETLALLLPAARGLAAAHRAGVVHRDFKPENVLVGSDGRVRVSDFGLAGAGDVGGDPISGEELGSQDTVRFSGAAAGTPAYMSPEQHLREPVDARADQFGFCVTLYEALYGRRPFPGATVREIRRQVVSGDLEPPRDPAVPAWLRAVLARGLRRDPARRFPSMDALITALESDPALLRRRLALAGGLAVLGAAAVYGLASRSAGAPVCESGDRLLGGVWDDATRAEVRARFVASGRPYAEDTYRRVAARLDPYTASWSAMRRDACEATAVRHEQSAALLDLRMECLDRRLVGVRDLVALFAGTPDPALVDRAVPAVARLDDLESCADAAALTSVLPPPPGAEARQRLGGLRARLERDHVLLVAGRSRSARALAETLLVEARALGYPPALAEALLASGRADRAENAFAAAEAKLREGVVESARARDVGSDVRINALLLYVVGVDEGRTTEALALIPGTRAAVLRAGGDRHLQQVATSSVGSVLMRAGRFDEARGEIQAAVDLAVALDGPQSYEAALGRNDLAVLLRRTHHEQEALALLEQIRDTFANTLGPEHPNVAGVTINIGNALLDLGRQPEAQAAYRAAAAGFEKAYGPDNASVARALTGLAKSLHASARFEEAAEVARRALAIKEKSLGPEHVDLATNLSTLALELHFLGRDADAVPYARRALALREKAFGPDHFDVAEILERLAIPLAALGQRAEARAAIDRAVAIRLAGDEKEGLEVAQVLSSRAQIDLSEGKAAEALADADRAIALYRKRVGDKGNRSTDAFARRGEALLALGRAREAAEALEHAMAFRGPDSDVALARLQAALRAANAAAKPSAGGRGR